MPIRLPVGRSVFFLCALLFALVALLPLRLVLGWLALDAYGLSAREVGGSVWFGRLAEARVGDAPLGELDARLNVLPLLTGRARIDLDRAGNARHAFEGAVSITRHSLGFDDVTARVPLGQRLAPLPVVALDLRDVSVRFRDGLCVNANGLVKAQIEGAVAGISLPGGLAGNARCNGGALFLPLASQSGMESLALSIRPEGSFRADLTIRPTAAATRDALLAAGFTPAAGGYSLSLEGTM